MSNPQVKHRVHSIKFIKWCCLQKFWSIKSNGNRWKQSGEWTEREKESSGLVEGETECWEDMEMAVEKDTWVFQIDQMNRTNKMSIKWDINNLGWVSNSFVNCAVTFVLLTMHLSSNTKPKDGFSLGLNEMFFVYLQLNKITSLE